jgi:hypothetical protein
MQNRVGPPDVPLGRSELRGGSRYLRRRFGRQRSPTLQATRVLRRLLRRGARRRGWQHPLHPERTPWWTRVGPTRGSETRESEDDERGRTEAGLCARGTPVLVSRRWVLEARPSRRVNPLDVGPATPAKVRGEGSPGPELREMRGSLLSQTTLTLQQVWLANAEGTPLAQTAYFLFARVPVCA